MSPKGFEDRYGVNTAEALAKAAAGSERGVNEKSDEKVEVGDIRSLEKLNAQLDRLLQKIRTRREQHGLSHDQLRLKDSDTRDIEYAKLYERISRLRRRLNEVGEAADLDQEAFSQLRSEAATLLNEFRTKYNLVTEQEDVESSSSDDEEVVAEDPATNTSTDEIFEEKTDTDGDESVEDSTEYRENYKQYTLVRKEHSVSEEGAAWWKEKITSLAIVDIPKAFAALQNNDSLKAKYIRNASLHTILERQLTLEMILTELSKQIDQEKEELSVEPEEMAKLSSIVRLLNRFKKRVDSLSEQDQEAVFNTLKEAINSEPKTDGSEQTNDGGDRHEDPEVDADNEDGPRLEWLQAREEAIAASATFNKAHQEYYQTLHSNKWKSAYQSAKSFGRDLFGIRPKLPPDLEVLQQQELEAQQKYTQTAEKMVADNQSENGGQTREQRNRDRISRAWKRFRESQDNIKRFGVDEEAMRAAFEQEVLPKVDVFERHKKMLDYATVINRMQERQLAQEQVIAKSEKIKSLEAMKAVFAGKRGTAFRVGLFGAIGLTTGGVSSAVGAVAGVAGGIVGGFATRFGYEKTLTQRVRRAHEAEFTKMVNSLDATQLEQRRAEVLESMYKVRSSERRKDVASMVGAMVGGASTGAFAESYVPSSNPDTVPPIVSEETETGQTASVDETVLEGGPEPLQSELDTDTGSGQEAYPDPENLLEAFDWNYTVEAGDQGVTYILHERFPELFPPIGSEEWLPFVEDLRTNEALMTEAGFPNENINNIWAGDQFQADVFVKHYLDNYASPGQRAAFIANL